MKIKITNPLYTAEIKITPPELNQRYQGREDEVYAALAIHLTSALAFLNAPDEVKPKLLGLDEEALGRKMEIIRFFRQSYNLFQPSSTPVQISPSTPPTIETVIREEPKDPSKLN